MNRGEKFNMLKTELLRAFLKVFHFNLKYLNESTELGYLDRKARSLEKAEAHCAILKKLRDTKHPAEKTLTRAIFIIVKGQALISIETEELDIKRKEIVK